MFVNQNYKRTIIANILNAQGVIPPHGARGWNTRTISTILEDPVYIGANQYSGSIRYDVFQSFVNKSIFYEAQVKILSDKNFRSISHIINIKKNYPEDAYE